jgi:hypothetical protein
VLVELNLTFHLSASLILPGIGLIVDTAKLLESKPTKLIININKVSAAT